MQKIPPGEDQGAIEVVRRMTFIIGIALILGWIILANVQVAFGFGELGRSQINGAMALTIVGTGLIGVSVFLLYQERRPVRALMRFMTIGGNCPSCGALFLIEAKYCSACGKVLPKPEEKGDERSVNRNR